MPVMPKGRVVRARLALPGINIGLGNNNFLSSLPEFVLRTLPPPNPSMIQLGLTSNDRAKITVTFHSCQEKSTQKSTRSPGNLGADTARSEKRKIASSEMPT